MDADDTDFSPDASQPAVRRGRGRPRGSRNKSPYRSPFEPVVIPPHRADRVVDPMRLVDDQLRLLSWTQELITKEFQATVDGKYDAAPCGTDVRRLSDLSAAIARVLDSMKKSHDLADELSKRLSAEQLLEKAIAKIEGQDIKTLDYAIKRLRAYKERVKPDARGESVTSVADAIAGLEDE